MNSTMSGELFTDSGIGFYQKEAKMLMVGENIKLPRKGGMFGNSLFSFHSIVRDSFKDGTSEQLVAVVKGADLARGEGALGLLIFEGGSAVC